MDHKTHISPPPLSLPPAPRDLRKAEAEYAAADEALKLANRSLQITKSRTTFAGQPAANPEEIAAAEDKVKDASTALAAIQVRRGRLRLEYEAKCREELGPALAALRADVDASTDHLINRLVAAHSLHDQMRVAGINLGDRFLSASDRFNGLVKILRGSIEMLERH